MKEKSLDRIMEKDHPQAFAPAHPISHLHPHHRPQSHCNTRSIHTPDLTSTHQPTLNAHETFTSGTAPKPTLTVSIPTFSPLVIVTSLNGRLSAQSTPHYGTAGTSVAQMSATASLCSRRIGTYAHKAPERACAQPHSTRRTPSRPEGLPPRRDLPVDQIAPTPGFAAVAAAGVCS